MNWPECFSEYKHVFRVHAIERMFERNIDLDDIEQVGKNFEIIEEYPNDFPFPSCLVLGINKSNRPIHVVFSVNHKDKTVIIVTAYKPNKDKWEDNFKRRKS